MVPLEPIRPIDRSTDDRVTLLSFLPLLYALRVWRGRVLFGASVRCWNALRDNLFEKYFSPPLPAPRHVRVCGSICKRSRCAKKLRELGRESTIFLREYVYIARYDLSYHVLRVGIKSSKHTFAQKQ